nr:acyl-CoA-binding protein [Photobacterium sanguinicancri]
MFDFKGTAKFEAWEKLQGMNADDAMQKYVDIVEKLTKTYA